MGAPPLLARLEENLAPVFGRGMAPYVVRRALRRVGKTEDTVTDRDVDALIRQIEMDSLDRIYGANARALAAEIHKHVHQGTLMDPALVRAFARGTTALERVRELL